jgi:dipeptidyl aminopeptidase/acylaminoacyl peptidase
LAMGNPQPDTLKHMKAPLLVIHGTAEPVFPTSTARRLRE